MRIAVGGLLFEGNTFSKVRTELADFENKYLLVGEAMIDGLRDTNVEVAGAISALESARCGIAPLMATHGGAGGRVTAEGYAELKRLLFNRLQAVGPIDGLYLALHGAMICEGEDDAEGDILRAVRSLVGEVPVSVSCDMHAHITRCMVDNCSILVGYQHYPHDDAFETGARAAGLLVQTLRGKIKPTLAMRKVALLTPAFAHGSRQPGPIRDFYRWSRGTEAAGRALAVSYFPVQPWLDLEDVGFAAVVVTNDEPAAADELALELVASAWDRRHRFEARGLDAKAALRLGLEVEGTPVILSDTSDCAGAGAAGDSARMLEAYLESGIGAPLLIHIVDPELVEVATEVGVGATVVGDLGSKIDTSYGPPLRIEALVTRLFQGDFTYSGGLLGGVKASMGKSAVLAIRNAVVVVSSQSAYEYGDEHFRSAGLDVKSFKFVVVKNPMNFKQAYSWAPERFHVNLPGASTSDLRSLSWRRAQRPFYPVDDREVAVFRPSDNELCQAVVRTARN